MIRRYIWASSQVTVSVYWATPVSCVTVVLLASTSFQTVNRALVILGEVNCTTRVHHSVNARGTWKAPDVTNARKDTLVSSKIIQRAVNNAIVPAYHTSVARPRTYTNILSTPQTSGWFLI
uniref:Uncharacterized protein n=1 Tax=Cacopsylla melanoneura TaxID=428564 RepID=A0A8D8PR12_9HEMI